MSTMQFECPLCRQPVEAGSDMMGQPIQCPHCQQLVRVPVPATPPPTPVQTSAPASTAPAAIWSLVLSILGFACCCILTAIPGVICGHVGLSKIKRSGGRLGGHGLCVAGLIIGYISIVLSLMWTVWVLFYGGMAMLEGMSNKPGF